MITFDKLQSPRGVQVASRLVTSNSSGRQTLQSPGGVQVASRFVENLNKVIEEVAVPGRGTGCISVEVLSNG